MKRASEFSSMQGSEQHSFRKKVKRLRYGVELSVVTKNLAPRRIKRLRKPLRRLQTSLGDLQDTRQMTERFKLQPSAAAQQRKREEELLEDASIALKKFQAK